MHEYSIVQSLFDQIETISRARHAVAVKRVAVRIGSAAGLDVSLFRSAYDVYRVRTICDGATLDVEEVPVRWTCPEGHGDIPAGRVLTCAACGRPARLETGDEITLMALDLEVA
jgi:hydrogenase nickel incorporation protein HypA/HybF